ncbi:MAG: hypothetical protein IH596_06305 [Bacteroidales bacterium]|nr:hypothetical protein [Bacteroidales bacterium]
MIRNLLSRTIIISLFAIAMGFLESAVVVYLRAIYYPEGFAFPLKIIDGPIAVTEILREAATMIMLLTVCMLTAQRWIIRFAWFIYMFAIWDIFYYVFLWLILGWPESLLSWDILFLIPTTWVGPVLAPLMNSVTMIVLGLAIIQVGQVGQVGRVGLTGLEWGLLIIGSLITMAAYMEDYTRFMLKKFTLIDWVSLSDKSAILEYSGTYIPGSFNWLLFLSGTFLFFLCIFLFSRRSFSSTK